MQQTSFEKWMKQVDEAMRKKYLVSVHDCPDVDFRGLYQTGDTPEQAADFVYENANES